MYSYEENEELHNRMSFSVRSIEGFQWVDVSASPTHPSSQQQEKTRILGVEEALHYQRDPLERAVIVHAKSVESSEWRVRVTVSSSLTITLNQVTALLFQEYLNELMNADDWLLVVDDADAGSGPFIRNCIIDDFVVKVRYRSEKLRIQALASGDAKELLNVVPLSSVTLEFTKLELHGITGLSSMFDIALAEWMNDMRQRQVVQLVTGLAHLKPFMRAVTVTRRAIKSADPEKKKNTKALVRRALADLIKEFSS